MLIALDSNVFIAALSEHEPHSLVAQQLIREVAAGKYRAAASSIVCGEVLSVSNAKEELDVESFLSLIKNLSTVPADDAICSLAGKLRLEHGSSLKLPDALHVATALASKADVFITNDKPLAKTAQKLLTTTLLADWK